MIGRVNMDGRGHCTGTLVGENLVLTASHCIWDKKGERWYKSSLVHFVAGYNQYGYAGHSPAARIALSRRPWLARTSRRSERCTAPGAPPCSGWRRRARACAARRAASSRSPRRPSRSRATCASLRSSNERPFGGLGWLSLGCGRQERGDTDTRERSVDGRWCVCGGCPPPARRARSPGRRGVRGPRRSRATVRCAGAPDQAECSNLSNTRASRRACCARRRTRSARSASPH